MVPGGGGARKENPHSAALLPPPPACPPPIYCRLARARAPPSCRRRLPLARRHGTARPTGARRWRRAARDNDTVRARTREERRLGRAGRGLRQEARAVVRAHVGEWSRRRALDGRDGERMGACLFWFWDFAGRWMHGWHLRHDPVSATVSLFPGRSPSWRSEQQRAERTPARGPRRPPRSPVPITIRGNKPMGVPLPDELGRIARLQELRLLGVHTALLWRSGRRPPRRSTASCSEIRVQLLDPLLAPCM